jgi:hypothetical protein
LEVGPPKPGGGWVVSATGSQDDELSNYGLLSRGIVAYLAYTKWSTSSFSPCW